MKGRGRGFLLGYIVVDCYRWCVCSMVWLIHPHLLPSTIRLITNPVASLPISTMPHSFKVCYIPCPVKSCTCQFTNQGHLKNHIQMHRMPQANQDLPAHQPPMNDDKILVDIDEDAQELHPEDQNHALNPDKVAKEKITYHPLINGMPSHFYSQKFS